MSYNSANPLFEFDIYNEITEVKKLCCFISIFRFGIVFTLWKFK